MKRPDRVWEADYRHDRRKHRHRCRWCNRIVEEGERVLFGRVAPRRTWVVHVACADIPQDGMTMREKFHAWAEGVSA